MTRRDFQTGEVFLPGLKSVRLPAGAYLQVVEVTSVRNYFLEMFFQIMIKGERQGTVTGVFDRLMDRVEFEIGKFFYEDKIPQKSDWGVCSVFKPGQGGQYAVIAQRVGLSLAKSIFTAGHESGHLLEKINKKEVLQAWLNEAGIRLNIESFTGEELADVGGLLALTYRRQELLKGGKILDILPALRHRESIKVGTLAKFELGEQSTSSV